MPLLITLDTLNIPYFSTTDGKPDVEVEKNRYNFYDIQKIDK